MSVLPIAALFSLLRHRTSHHVVPSQVKVTEIDRCGVIASVVLGRTDEQIAAEFSMTKREARRYVARLCTQYNAADRKELSLLFLQAWREKGLVPASIVGVRELEIAVGI